MDTLHQALHDRIYSLFLQDSSISNLMALAVGVGVLKSSGIISESVAEDLLSIFNS